MWYNEYKMDDINVLNDTISKNKNCVVFCERYLNQFKIHVCNDLVIKFNESLYYNYESLYSFVVETKNIYDILHNISQTHKIILSGDVYYCDIKLPINNNIYHQENLNIIMTNQLIHYYSREYYDKCKYNHLLIFLNAGNQLLPMHITNIVTYSKYSNSYSYKQKFLKLLHKYDIPLSFDNILQSIKNCCELPYVHKYGYDMNSIPFLCKYVKRDFYPSSYNIAFPQYFVQIYDKLRHVNKMIRLVNVIKDAVNNNEPIYIIGVYGESQSHYTIVCLLLFKKNADNIGNNIVYSVSCDIDDYPDGFNMSRKNNSVSFADINHNMIDLLKTANNGKIYTNNSRLYDILKTNINICIDMECTNGSSCDTCCGTGGSCCGGHINFKTTIYSQKN